MPDPDVSVNPGPGQSAPITASLSEENAPQANDEIGQARVAAANQPPPAVSNAAPPSMPAGSSRQPAAPAPPPPGSMFRNLSHALIGGVLGSLLGPKETTEYTVDENGKTIATKTPLTTHDRLARMVQGALTGLGAAANAPARPGAPVLAGLGAGATAQMQKSKEQDLLKRQQASEDFERNQRETLQKASIANMNAQTLNHYLSAVRTAEDLDPVRAQNQKLVDELQGVQAEGRLPQGMTAQTTTFDEAMKTREAYDAANGQGSFLATHMVLPLGRSAVTDPKTGEPVLGADGKPQTQGNVAVISGMHQGNMPLPQATYDQYEKYGERAGLKGSGVGELKPGQDIDVRQWIGLSNTLNQERLKELGGWVEKEPGENAILNPDWKPGMPLSQKYLERNNISGETRLYAGGVPQKVLENEAAIKEKGTLAAQQQSAADLNNMLRRNGGAPGTPTDPAKLDPVLQKARQGLSPEALTELNTLPPDRQAEYIRGAHGWIDPNSFSNRKFKGEVESDRQKFERIAVAINPQYTDSLYKTISDTRDKYINGQEGKSIRSFNQFLVHSSEVLDRSDALQRTNIPAFNTPLNEMSSKFGGDPNVGNLRTAILAAREEWLTFIKSGYVPTKEEEEQANVLFNDSSTPSMIYGVLGVMGRQAVGRLDQLDESYKTATGGEEFPNLVTPSGMAAGKRLGIGDALQKYQSGGNYVAPNSGPSNLTNLHTNGQVTIGWDGTKWVDAKTGTPYQPTPVQ